MGKAQRLIYSRKGNGCCFYGIHLPMVNHNSNTHANRQAHTRNISYYLHLCFIGPIPTPVRMMDGCVFFPFLGSSGCVKWSSHDHHQHAPVPSHRNRKWLDRALLWCETDKRSVKVLLKRNIYHRKPQTSQRFSLTAETEPESALSNWLDPRVSVKCIYCGFNCMWSESDTGS